MPLSARTGRRWRASIRAAGMAVVAAQLFQAAPSFASSFQVNPVNLRPPPDKATTSLSIGHDTGDEVGIRVSALRWTQVAVNDVYAPSDDLIASPPSFMLEPHGKQLIRLGLRRRTPGAAYRVIVEEIPNEKASGTGIKVALRLNLPLYIEAETEGAPELRWSAWQDATGATVLQARNDGTAHSQILSITAMGSDGRQIAATKRSAEHTSELQSLM